MRFTDAAKVGLTVLVAALALAYATFSLRGSMLGRGSYLQQVTFPHAQGIQEGAYVRVRGVDMGTVETVGLGPRGQALLTLRISDEYRVKPEDAITISGGLFGFNPPWVEITPGGREQPVAVAPGEPLEGETGPGTDRLLTRAEVLLENLNDLSVRMNRVTEGLARYAEDPQLRRSLTRTASNFERISESGIVIARNMQSATAQADRLVDSFEGTARRLDRTLQQADRLFAGFQGTADESRALMRETRGAVGELRETVKDTRELVKTTNNAVETAGGLASDARLFFTANRGRLQEVLESLDSSLKQLDGTLTEARSFIADPELRSDLKSTATNIREATLNLREISEDVRGLTGDPKLQEDLRVTIGNLRDLSDEAGDVFRRVRTVLGGTGSTAKSVGRRIAEASLDAEFVHSVRGERPRIDFNATIPWTDSFLFKVGMYDFGERNRFNAQAGQLLREGIWGRYGIYASKVAVGLDVGNPLRPPFSFDLYGLDRPRLDARGNIPVGRNFDVTLGLDNIFRRPDPIFGLRYRR
jgi:phospholipid/cholesterol/gamma-HCH transport system substrate-binding protein